MPINGGGEVSLSQFRGQAVVLYFYPKDNTPGCNKEAKRLPRQPRRDYREKRRRARRQRRLGGQIRQVHREVRFAFHADRRRRQVDLRILRRGNKSFMGRTFLGIKRMTFLINADGVVRKSGPRSLAATTPASAEALGEWEVICGARGSRAAFGGSPKSK